MQIPSKGVLLDQYVNFLMTDQLIQNKGPNRLNSEKLQYLIEEYFIPLPLRKGEDTLISSLYTLRPSPVVNEKVFVGLFTFSTSIPVLFVALIVVFSDTPTN